MLPTKLLPSFALMLSEMALWAGIDFEKEILSEEATVVWNASSDDKGLFGYNVYLDGKKVEFIKDTKVLMLDLDGTVYLENDLKSCVPSKYLSPLSIAETSNFLQY